MTLKHTLILCIVCALVGAGLNSYMRAPVTVVQTKVVEKVVNRDVVKVVKQTKAPDGTVVTETVVTDKSTAETNSATSKAISVPAPNWLVGATYAINSQSYGLAVQRRIAGPIFAHVSVEQSGAASIGLLIEF